MLRTPDPSKNVFISVYLKDGTYYEKRDVPPEPFSQTGRFVSFWDGDSLLIYPCEDVRAIRFHYEE